MTCPPHELLVERNAFSTQRTIGRIVSWEIAADEPEYRLAVHPDRRPAPQAPDPHGLRAELLDELDQKVQGGAARDEVLDEEDTGRGPDQPLELYRQRDAPLPA